MSDPAQFVDTNLLEWTKAIAPVGAAVIGAVAVGLTILYGFRRGAQDAKHNYVSEALKLRIRQATEFYAPMLLHLEQSRILYEKLKWTIKHIEDANPKVTGVENLNGFRLLDHIHRFRTDENLGDLKIIVDKILAVGDRMSELMGKNAGLIEGGVTDTFCQYQAHLDLLKAASETKAPKDAKEGWQEFGYYPRLLNREVREGYKLVIRNLERLQDAADTTLCKLLGLEYRDYRQAVRKLLENVSYYEKNVKAYAIRFDSFDLTPLRRRFTGHIKPKTQDDGPPTILEVGAGTGRDCAAFINDGFVVKAFDITPAMVRECNRKIRFIRDNGISEDAKMRARESNCIELSFDEMSYRNEFDGVWASASLLHVPKSDFPTILHAMLGALRPKGVLFMSFKYGIGEHEFDSRHYSYFRRREICHMVDGLREASVIEIWITDSKGNDLGPLRSFAASVGNYFNRNSANWVNVLLRKSAP